MRWFILTASATRSPTWRAACCGVPMRASCEVYAKRRWVCPLKTFYQAVAPKTPVALVGSSGFLEIAVNGGSAEKALGVRIGTRVVLRTHSSPLR